MGVVCVGNTGANLELSESYDRSRRDAGQPGTLSGQAIFGLISSGSSGFYSPFG